MRMYNGSKIIAGLIIFAGVVTFPFLYNMGKVIEEPKPELSPKAKEAKYCVESKEYMRANHMQMLYNWRETAVRDGKRVYVSTEGKEYNKSLQNTCMECHLNKKKFCARCHNYMGVALECWDCHLEPKEKYETAILSQRNKR